MLLSKTSRFLLQRFPSLVLMILLAAGLSGLSSCGFRPLYETQSDGNFSELGDVWIDNLPNRDGQILRNALTRLMNPYGPPKHPSYVLKVRLSETTTSHGILQDATASQMQYTITASFDLWPHCADAGEKPLLTSTSRGVANYNVMVSHPFSTETESSFAREKLLNSIALDIRNQIASYFLLRDKALEGSPQEKNRAASAMRDLFPNNPKSR